MKLILLAGLVFSLGAYAAETVKATFTRLGAPKDEKPLFFLDLTTKLNGPELQVNADTRDSEGKMAIAEEARLNNATAELIEYKVDQHQTGEKGRVQIADGKIKIKYEVRGKPAQEKEIPVGKASLLVSPGNFEKWLEVHFDELKKEGSLSVDFLVWDRLETIKFKVTYLGEGELNGKKVQKFKMNINNFLLAVFISPIRVWRSADMKQMLLYEGRVSLKQVKGPELESLDAQVVYIQDLKAAQ